MLFTSTDFTQSPWQADKLKYVRKMKIFCQKKREKIIIEKKEKPTSVINNQKMLSVCVLSFTNA